MNFLAFILPILGYMVAEAKAACSCGQANYIVTSNRPAYLPTSQFAANCNCNYYIQTPVGTQVYVDVFHSNLQNATNSLTFSDPVANKVIQTCTGQQSCPSVTTSGNFAMLTYKSAVQGGSFFITASPFSSVTTPPPSCNCGGQPLQTLSTTSSTAEITSPNFPDLYPANCDCTWRITTQSNWRVFATLKYVNLESQYDTVCLYAGQTPSQSNKVQCCSGGTCSAGQSFTIESSVTTVVFHSDGSQNLHGFDFALTAAPKLPCDSVNCGPNGQCVNDGSSNYHCNCQLGYTGNYCSLPGCFYTIQNGGAYILSVAYSSAQGASSFRLIPGSQSFFTATADTTVTLGAVLGASTSFSAQQCFSQKTIVCGGSSIVGFNCQVQ